jgi:hypothetical protein
MRSGLRTAWWMIKLTMAVSNVCYNSYRTPPNQQVLTKDISAYVQHTHLACISQFGSHVQNYNGELC